MKAIVYTTSWCPYCKEAISYLEGKNVEVVEKNIEESEEIKDELLDKVGFFTGVPVIDIEGKILSGFAPGKIDKALGKS